MADRPAWQWPQLGRQHRLLMDAALLGIVGALCAQALTLLLRVSQTVFLNWIAGYHLPTFNADGSLRDAGTGAHGLWLIPLSTTLGGIFAGVLIYTLAPEAEGHGTDAVVNAYHNLAGVIRARVPIVKLVASAFTIGSGGSAGREGPTALMSAGIASLYASWRRRSDDERRLLMLVGAAAGLAAIFRSPIGTAIFAVEVLYSEAEFETGALIYTMFGSIVAYAVNGFFVGFEPLFNVPPKLAGPTTVTAYGWFALLGIVSGVVATALPMALYTTRDLFRRMRVPRHIKPAIGGLVVGLIALALPEVLGGGYGWMQSAIDGGIATNLLLVLAVGKTVAFAITVGSGGSGGVFAPGLFTGAMLGGFLAHWFHQPPAAFVVVGMAAVFAGAARVPIATLLMVSEMTGGYQLLVAAGLAVILSTVVQTVLSAPLKYRSLYEAQVPTRADSPAHYARQVQRALDLLRKGAKALFPKDRTLELLPILSAGVPVSLTGGNRLRIGVLAPGSACVGQPADGACFGNTKDQMRFLLVIRANKLLTPRADLKLEPGDQIVAAASDDAWAEVLGKLGNAPPP